MRRLSETVFFMAFPGPDVHASGLLREAGVKASN
jgi:hypothetical protein